MHKTLRDISVKVYLGNAKYYKAGCTLSTVKETHLCAFLCSSRHLNGYMEWLDQLEFLFC